MTSASTELRRAVFATLSQDADLIAALDGNRIFDRVPERVAPPYVVAGRTTVSDWSTATEEGETIVFFIHVWTKRNSRREADDIAAAIRRVLVAPLPPLGGHALVNLRFQIAESRRDRETGHVHTVMRFRAVIEPTA